MCSSTTKSGPLTYSSARELEDAIDAAREAADLVLEGVAQVLRFAGLEADPGDVEVRDDVRLDRPALARVRASAA